MAKDDSTKNLNLRDKAEELLKKRFVVDKDLTGMSSHDLTRLVHELRVH
jgi:hypothetical protein